MAAGNTEFLMDTGNTVFIMDTGSTEFMIDTGSTEFMLDTGRVGQTIKIQESRRPGDSSPGCRRTPFRSHSGISSGHRDVITDFLHAEFHASAAFRRFVTGAYFSVIKEIFAPHVSR